MERVKIYITMLLYASSWAFALSACARFVAHYIQPAYDWSMVFATATATAVGCGVPIAVYHSVTFKDGI
jgi:hypothetical protein